MREVLAAASDTESVYATWRNFGLKSLPLTMLLGAIGLIVFIFINNLKPY